MHLETGGDSEGAGKASGPGGDPSASDRGRSSRGRSDGSQRSGDPRDEASDQPTADGVSPGDELVCVGRIVKVRGTAGEMEVDLLGKTALGFDEPCTVFLEKTEGATPRAYTVERLRPLGRRLALKLEGVDVPESAKKLVGHEIMVEAGRLPPLPDGQYYYYQIVGLDVVDVNGKSLGRIEEVMETGGNDVYVVRAGDNEILIPAVENVIVQVDLEAGRMVVDLPPGLIE